ncbi:MAG TPA: MBL fold metallo-hydrolase [Bacteroidales bacterium]|jgi:phosphoribosyl 1,2-cyclic phosphate phosphodiesterase|nr:MBL fold metallo-hydrolase [Bacteroidales bacterium]
MNVRFLGTGTSTGVPQIGCRCDVCSSNDPRDNRLRASVMVEVGPSRLLIDCSPDFRQQVMPLPYRKIDGCLFTHEHYDHVGGIDDLRPFSRFGTVDLYMEAHLEEVIRLRMPYCFSPQGYKGVPDIRVRSIDPEKVFHVGEVEVTPIRVMHYKLPILGFRIGDFAYLTDVKTIPDGELEKLRGLDVLVISALRKTEHFSHQTLDQALTVIGMLQPRTAYLTHISHELGLHAEVEQELPEAVFLAYDGLEVVGR